MDNSNTAVIGKFTAVAAIVVFAIFASGCASTGDNDPFHTMNRGFHDINTGLDDLIMRPTAQA